MKTALCRLGQLNFTAPIFWMPSDVQTITVAATMTQGSQPCQDGTRPRVPIAPMAAGRTMAKAGSKRGFHTCRKPMVTTSEPSEARTSVSL